MKQHPILNALAAIAYIAVVVTFMQFIESVRHDTPDTPIDGLGFLSLLVFSAAVMAFLFFYQPVSLLIENKKHEALSYFLKTLGHFGMITILILTAMSLQ